MGKNADVEVHTITCEAAIAMVCDSPWGIAVVSADGRFEFVNAAYCNILGCAGSPSMVIGTQFSQWTHLDDRAVDIRMREEVRAGKIPGYIFKQRHVVRGPAGRWRWGILSVIGVWESQQFTNYQIQFLPLDEALPGLQSARWDYEHIKTAVVWLWSNRKTVAMIVVTSMSIFSALMARNWDVLSRALESPSQVTPDKSESLP